jgi:hypothetical protein
MSFISGPRADRPRQASQPTPANPRQILRGLTAPQDEVKSWPVCTSCDLWIAFHLVAENHGFGNFLHGSAFLPALPLQGEIGLFLA